MAWSDTTNEKGLEVLVDKKIVEIFMNDDYLVFTDTEGGFHGFTVEGDCCSHSYFHDFFGVRTLLENGPVVSVKSIDLGSEDLGDWDVISCYGFEIVTEHLTWGEQTSVFSFRNSSNGYYGGWMYYTDNIPGYFCQDKNKLTSDKV
jgi:hypothetical protein